MAPHQVNLVLRMVILLRLMMLMLILRRVYVDIVGDTDGHHQDSQQLVEGMLEATRRPPPPGPPGPPRAPPGPRPPPPRLPMASHRLPATLDEFLLLLGPGGAPRPRPPVRQLEKKLPKKVTTLSFV